MSVGVVAALLGLGLFGCLKARIVPAVAICAALFGFVLGLTSLGRPVQEALNSLGAGLFNLLTGR